MSYTERSDCRLCGGGLERVLDLGKTPLANGLVERKQLSNFGTLEWSGQFTKEFTAPLYLSRCLTCGHVQLPVVVDPKLLFPADYPYASSTGAAMREHLSVMAEELYADLVDDDLVVEIGSNDGYLLNEFVFHGARAIGVDPASSVAKEVFDDMLTVPEFFTRETAQSIRNGCGRAELVVANNVFAHADDLNEIVEGVKALLQHPRPLDSYAGGRFVFEVGYLPDVLASNNWPVVYHEHLSYHTLRPLIDFFARHDLGLYDAHRVDTQGGSIRCFVRRGPVETPKRLYDLVVAEPSPLVICDGWQSRVTLSAYSFAGCLRSLKEQGKSIAGYGCSAKSTTLLHVAGIGRETIDFICDSNPLKIGKFSPGKHIPIVHPDELEKRQPDVCVSLSGNFSEAFRARHPGFKGEWIEPQLNPSGEAAA